MNEAFPSLQPAWRDITSFPEFVFAAMAQRGSGTVEAEASDFDSVRQPPTHWTFRPLDAGSSETIADTRPPHFRTILARFARVCGISPYGGEAALSHGEHHYSVILRNSQQTGFGIRIELVSDDLMQSSAMAYPAVARTRQLLALGVFSCSGCTAPASHSASASLTFRPLSR